LHRWRGTSDWHLRNSSAWPIPLSDQTVKFHLHKIYRKLRVSNRTEATRLAHGLGLVPDLALAA
jgi:Bacterial regulatory proteins, luxR family